MNFAYPWLLALPLAYLLIASRRRRAKSPAVFPSTSFLALLPRSWRQKIRGPVLNTLITITVMALAVAAARPQKISVIEQERNGRNIILAVDVSHSMAAQDFPSSFGHTSRMEGIKSVVAEYVRARSNDRVGLVVFGNTAYLQSPVTTDTTMVEELVRSLQPRMAGDGTAIGDGLGLALKRLRDVSEGTKAIILMTDGVNTAGRISPLKAAEVAATLGIQVHTIGIGTGSAPLLQQPLGGILGVPLGPMADFDEKTLKLIAEKTGGEYFNARSLEAFKEVYKKIEKLTETTDKQSDRTIIEELFPPFVMVALAAYVLAIVLTSTYLLKVP